MSRVTIAEIKQAVAEEFGVDLATLEGQRRTAEYVRARHAALWLAQRLTPHSYTAIAKRMGHRAAKSVTIAVRRIDAALVADEDLARRIAALERRLTEPMH
ncbi:helix-turn-helix domain-containing protein [Phenylobacterium sp.]|uniref:helix-turn-helix domain-containing protein n=1 Tax=Phenylobacterium sp. TaxID=1871053 RepID=UPI0019CBEB1C|nr:helix-turn-helix domain-containing protein [Phenylobacterium sp.]MBC7168705.1 hypothetical protein [Phenylobacterium sp.]